MFWPIAEPLRIAKGAGRMLVRGSSAWLMLKPGSRPRRLVRRWSVAIVRYFRARPHLARPARRLLRRLPRIEGRLRMMLVSPADTPRAPIPRRLFSDLSPRARGIYTELKAAIAKREAST